MKRCQICRRHFGKGFTTVRLAKQLTCSRQCGGVLRRAPPPRSKVCANCHMQYSYKGYQKHRRTRRWSTRKFCSHKCAQLASRQTPRFYDCDVCGKRFERSCASRQARTCGRTCRYKLTAKSLGRLEPPPPRRCETCGKSFGKRPRDTLTQFLNRRFCCATCQRAVPTLKAFGVPITWLQICRATLLSRSTIRGRMRRNGVTLEQAIARPKNPNCGSGRTGLCGSGRHRLAAGNLYIYGGDRRCKACHDERMRRRFTASRPVQQDEVA